MTVSTLNGVTAELRRSQENLNKPERLLPLQPSNASLPDDVVADSAIAPRGPDLATAIAQTEAQNREAARATLNDADLDAIADAQPSAREQVASSPKTSIAAQTGRLPANVLDLLAE